MNDIAPEGKMFQCMACGKVSKTRYGFYSDGSGRGLNTMPDGTAVATRGWDESCMLNCELVDLTLTASKKYDRFSV